MQCSFRSTSYAFHQYSQTLIKKQHHLNKIRIVNPPITYEMTHVQNLNIFFSFELLTDHICGLLVFGKSASYPFFYY